MNPQLQARLEAMLETTLEDERLSRSESRAVGEVMDDLAEDPEALGFVRNRAFALARTRVHEHPEAVLAWLQRVDRIVDQAARSTHGPRRYERVAFSPGEDCLELILEHLRGVRRTLEICVFTITDDRIAREILQAHERGVLVRIISDDDKAGDLGSDVERLQAGGVAVRRDRSPNHMHHKFAVVDGRVLLNGSFNWTRGASHNYENVHATNRPHVVEAFLQQFESLWDRLG